MEASGPSRRPGSGPRRAGAGRSGAAGLVLRVVHDLVDEVAEVEHEGELLRRARRARPRRSSGGRRSARPRSTFWQLTNVKRTGRGSSAAGAVRVRPMRLPCPPSPTKRYQYVCAGRSPPTSTRQVWSASASARVCSAATTRSKAASSATSTVSGTTGADPPADARVQSSTLSGCGSPEATPSAKRSRRSTQRSRERHERDPPQASVAPIAAAPAMNSRRVIRLTVASSIRRPALAWPPSDVDSRNGGERLARGALPRARAAHRPRRGVPERLPGARLRERAGGDHVPPRRPRRALRERAHGDRRHRREHGEEDPRVLRDGDDREARGAARGSTRRTSSSSSRIPGLGPKTLLRLRSELGVRTSRTCGRARGPEASASCTASARRRRRSCCTPSSAWRHRGKDKRRPIAEALPIARRAGRGARGPARGRARPVLRQPAAAARDGGRRRHRRGLDASPRPCARRS